MKYYDYKGRTISQCESGAFKGKYLVPYKKVCLVCSTLSAAQKVIESELKRKG